MERRGLNFPGMIYDKPEDFVHCTKKKERRLVRLFLLGKEGSSNCTLLVFRILLKLQAS